MQPERLSQIVKEISKCTNLEDAKKVLRDYSEELKDEKSHKEFLENIVSSMDK